MAGRLTLKDGTILPYIVLPSPAGQALPLLMIQGLSGSKENWFSLPTELAKTRPVAVFDNRGIAQRPVPEGPYSVELMASDAVAVADHLGWKQFDLLGISMGGAISQVLTLNYPSRVRKLIIGCSSACFTAIESHEAIEAITPPHRKLTPEEQLEYMRKGIEINLTLDQVTTNPKLVDDMLEMELKLKKPAAGIGMDCFLHVLFYFSFLPKTKQHTKQNILFFFLAHQFMGLATYDIRDRLKEIKHQTLIITGSQDRLVSYQHSILMSEGIPNSTLRFIPNTGHLFYYPDSLPTVRLVNEFLAQPSAKL